MHMPVIRLSARLLAVTLCLLTLTASAGGRRVPSSQPTTKPARFRCLKGWPKECSKSSLSLVTSSAATS